VRQAAWFEKISEAFFKNPFAWILLVLLGVAEYGNYQRSEELDRVCELTGPHDVSVAIARTPREEIDNICIGREPEEEDTPMRRRIATLFAGGLLVLLLFSVAAAGQFEDAASAYRDGDYAAALGGFRSLADQGHAVAQYDLGRMYYEGLGVRRNVGEALSWFRLAAAQGHAGAENSLGALFLAGDGVEQSTSEALRWYRLAADQGYVIAQHNLGSLYITGRYMPPNFAEGAKWFRRAADQGYASSMLGLAALYEDGNGFAKDSVLALMW
jgi:TPR repeat protein